MNGYEPIQSSQGFDGIAAQRQWWAGQNNATERANMEAYNQAQAARNAWIARQQELQRQDQAQSANQAAAADQAATQRYQFNANLQLNKDQLAAATQTKKSEDAQRQADKTLNFQLNQATQDAEDGTFDPQKYPKLPPEVVAPLVARTAVVRAGMEKDYFSGVALAQKLNEAEAKKKELANSMVLVQNIKDPSYTTRDSDLLALKAKAQQLTDSIAPFKGKNGEYAFGVMPDPKTGAFVPPEPLPWLAKKQSPQATITQTGSGASPSWLASLTRGEKVVPVGGQLAPLTPTVQPVQSSATPISQPTTPAQKKAQMANLIAIKNPTWTRKQIIDEVNRTFQP